MSLARLHSAQQWVERFGQSRQPAVLTIGNFDGMHRGHQEILKRVLQQARARQCMSAVLTFFPHPVRVLRPAEAPPLLMTLDQRLAAFDAAGIDAALVLPFNEALSKMSAESFVRKYPVETMRAQSVLVGENFRFGHRQQGNVNTLQSLGAQLGFEVEIIGSLKVDGIIVSSTAVRAAIGEGRMEDAAHLLGRPFTLTGNIQPGTGQGRTLVVPTLNLKTEQEMLPKTGVYVTETALGKSIFPSVTNLGLRPTFNGAHLTVESYLFDFDRELNSGEMEVQFLKRLRDEKKFSGPGPLREQVLKDIASAREFHRVRQK
jgi:riboflavin kinase / FMN adenylyltransferase